MRLIKLASTAAGAGLALSAIVVTDNAVHVPERVPENSEAVEALARNTDSSWKEISVTAPDGVADTRKGMLAHADFLLRGGFTVLVPDIRGHGKSGGAITTYGVREASDPVATRLWLVPGAGHVGSFGADPQNYPRNVIFWFQTHP
jgi:X-Pro dipeptidyl-peptidase-like protein